MINTCSYKNFKSELLKSVSISADKGKNANFYGNYYSLLAPKKEFWDIWNNNKDKKSDEENNRYYIEEYYKQVLAYLDPLKVYRDLDYSIILCYEEENDFCHRHIVAAWFELFLGFEVKEVKVNGMYKEEIAREQYEFIKNTLYQVIKENINMRGFRSLRALYLFNKGEELEIKAGKLEDSNSIQADRLYQSAAYLRSDADMEEEKYLKELKKN